MNFSGVGGITIVVVACLWIFVFIPSWFNAAAERTNEKDQARAVKRAVAEARKPILKAPSSKVASLSEQIYRVHRTGRALAFSTWMFALTAVALGFAASKFGFLWSGAISATIFALVALRFWSVSNAKAKRLLVGSIRSRGASTLTAYEANARAKAEALAALRAGEQARRAAEVLAKQQAAAEAALRRAREFKPVPLPAPSYASQLGSLEVPEFAEVVNLEPQTVDSETITEILRRRRQASA